MLKSLTDQLNEGQSLSFEQVQGAVMQLIGDAIAPDVKADFLTALARKGESSEEIAAFATELRLKSLRVPLDKETRNREILDVCGTGGDGLNTYNISTTVALVATAAGVTVAKHGNRAITSKSGSADVLETLGIPVDLTPEKAADALRDRRFAFLFAPNYHPAFRHIGPARKLCAERKQRTIFNFLGPLLNPAQPTAQLIGVPRPGLCEPVARVLQSLGVRRGIVVSGRVPPEAQIAGAASDLFLDEFSTLGENTIAEFYQDRGFTVSTLHPSQFPVQPAKLADLAGGDRNANAEITRALLHGEERGPKRDALLLNAAAALFVAGTTRTLADGWDLAAQLIDDGTTARKMKELTYV